MKGKYKSPDLISNYSTSSFTTQRNVPVCGIVDAANRGPQLVEDKMRSRPPDFCTFTSSFLHAVTTSYPQHEVETDFGPSDVVKIQISLFYKKAVKGGQFSLFAEQD